MKNLKKAILLLSILAAFTVSCKNAQQALNSSFEVIEDGTAEPATPPVSIIPEPGDERKPFPSEEELWLVEKEFYFDDSTYPNGLTHYFEFGYNKNDSNLRDFLYRTRYKRQSQTTVVERTKGVASASDLAKSVYIVNDINGLLYRNGLCVAKSAYDALGSAGQYAKMKVEIFFEDTEPKNNKDGYQSGSRTLWVEVKRNN